MPQFPLSASLYFVVFLLISISSASGNCPKVIRDDVSYCGDVLDSYYEFLRQECYSSDFKADKLCTNACCLEIMEKYSEMRDEECDKDVFERHDWLTASMPLYCLRNSSIEESTWCGDELWFLGDTLKSLVEIDCVDASCCKMLAYKAKYPQDSWKADLYGRRCRVKETDCVISGAQSILRYRNLANFIVILLSSRFFLQGLF